MEENSGGKQLVKRQKLFPWLKTFLDKLRKSFPDDCCEDLMPYLLENVNNEVRAVSVSRNRKRMKILFETIQDLFLHFWWRIRWKKQKFWGKFWKKDYTEEIKDYVGNDLRTKYIVKLLYFIIYIGIKLSKGSIGSRWISCILQAMNVLPDCDNIIYSSLLLIETLNKKYRCSYNEILKNILVSRATKCVSEPSVYIKILLLFRRLKIDLKDTNDKRELLSAFSKFQAPPNLIHWLTSFDLDLSKLKKKNIAHWIFKSSSNDFFKKLQSIVAENEFLPSRGESKDSKTSAENRKSSIDLDSTLNFFHLHSNEDLESSEVEEKQSMGKKSKKSKKKSEKTEIESEKGESMIAGSLDETLSVAVDNEEDDDGETSNLSFAQFFPTDVNKTTENLVDINSHNKTDSLSSQLSSPQLSSGDSQLPASPIQDRTSTSNKIENGQSLSKKDKTPKSQKKLKKDSKKRKERSEKEEILDESHSVVFANGEDDDGNPNLGVTPSSSPNIIENEINSCSQSANLSLYLSSPKQDTLVAAPALQLPDGDHQMPTSILSDVTKTKSNKIAKKTKKKKSLSKKDKTSKTDQGIPTAKKGKKSKNESEKRKSKSEEKSRTAGNLDETHSMASESGKDDDETASLDSTPSSPSILKKNAIKSCDIESSSNSVSLGVQLSSPKQDTSLLDSTLQLHDGDPEMPPSLLDETETKSNKIINKRKSLSKKDKTSKTDLGIPAAKKGKKSKKKNEKRKSKSEEKSRTAGNLDETHSMASESGKDDDETASSDSTPSSLSIINENAINSGDIESSSNSVSLGGQLSSPIQDTSLLDSTLQHNDGDHQMPPSILSDVTKTKSNKITKKIKKKKSLSKKDKTSKTDLGISTAKKRKKSEKKSEKRKSKSGEGESRTAGILDETHLLTSESGKDDDETASSDSTPSSLSITNENVINSCDIESSSNSVSLGGQLSSPMQDTSLLDSTLQLHDGEHQMPPSLLSDETETKSNKIINKRKSLSKKDKTSKTDLGIATAKKRKKSEKKSEKRKSKSEGESKTAGNLDETHPTASESGKDDDETASSDSTPFSPSIINENAINSCDIESSNDSVSLGVQLSSPIQDTSLLDSTLQLHDSDHQMPPSLLSHEIETKSNKIISKRKSLSKKDKTSKTDLGIPTPKKRKKSEKKSESEKESRTATNLDETHPLVSESGKDDDETASLDTIPSSPSIINKNAINSSDTDSSSNSVNLGVQLSSPKQGTSLLTDKTIIECNKIVNKKEKRKNKSESKKESKKRKRKSEKKEKKVAVNSDENHSVSFDNREDNDEIASLDTIPSSQSIINENAINLYDIDSSNKSVKLSSPKRNTLLFDPAVQLHAGDLQMSPSISMDKTSIKSNKIVEKIEKKKSLNLSKRGKTSKSGQKKLKLCNNGVFESSSNPIKVCSNEGVLCNTRESLLHCSTNENTAQDGGHKMSSSPEKNKTNAKSNKIVKKKEKGKSLSRKEKTPKAGGKKFKLFNTSTTNPIEVHSNQEALSNASESSANENKTHNVNMVHNSPKGKKLSRDKVVWNRHSRAFEESCLNTVENMQDDVTYNTLSAPLFDSMPDLSNEDAVTYNTQSAPLFDSMPDLSTDQYNSFEAENSNSTLVHPTLNHTFNGSSIDNPISYTDSSISKGTGGENKSKDYAAYEETINDIINFVENHTPVHLQHVNEVNPEGQITTDGNCSGSNSARLENFSSENSFQILEQLCNNFNSHTNLNSNSSSDLFIQNACSENELRNSVNENTELSGSQNLSQTDHSSVEVSASGFTIPPNKVLSSNNCNENSSFIIDCSFVNNGTNPQQPGCSLNSEISSIKFIINLNKKPGDNMQLQQPSGCYAGNCEINAIPLSGSNSSNTCNSFRTTVPITNQVMTQCNGYSSCCDINHSLRGTPMHPQPKIRVPENLASSTPYHVHEQTSAPKLLNNPSNKANYFASPIKCVPSTSQQKTSTDGSEFLSPHTSDCESYAPSGDIPLGSLPNTSSLQKNLRETNMKSASFNPMHVNITPAVSRLQNDHLSHSSRNSSRHCQPFNNVSEASSSLNKTYRNSANGIYSDVSGDDVSVSSIGVVTDEETDHSFLKGSSESPLKKKSCGSTNDIRTRTISNSSTEYHSTLENNYHRSKKVSFSNSNCGNTNSTKKASTSSIKPKTGKRKAKKSKIKSSYKLRDRRKIIRPSNLYDYFVKI